MPDLPARPSAGDTSSLALLSDTSSVGLLPRDYSLQDPAAYPPLARRQGDHLLTWIGPSVKCPGGDLGFFFEVPVRWAAGHLVGTYFGPNCRDEGISYQEALRRWADSDFVTVCPSS